MSSATGLNNENSSQYEEAGNWLMRMTSGNLDEKRFRAATRMSADLIDMIEKQIEGSKFQVNEVKKEFKLKQKQPEADEERKGNYSQWKKFPPHGQNQRLQKSQDKQKNLNHSHSEKKYFKSEMTQEQIQRIKQIKRAQRKHQLQLQQKRKIFEQNIRKLQEEENELLQKQKRQKNEERMKEVAKKIAQIRARQMQRTQKMEEQNKKIMKLKQEKTLYLKLDAKYRSVEQEQERKKQELKQAIKKQKLVSFDEIKEHQRKYDEIMRSQKEERQKKLGDLNRSNSKKYYQSRVLKDLIEESKMAKVEHIQKKNEVIERYHSQKQYAQMIREKIMPQMVVKQDDKFKDSKVQVPTVSFAEQFKMGNNYMKQVHQNLASLKGSSVSKVVSKKQEPFHYKDYLKDLRKDKKPTSHKENRYLEQINSLMKNQSMTQEQKFYKAKLLTEKIEQTKKGRNSQKLISSINAKLHLLKQISPTQE